MQRIFNIEKWTKIPSGMQLAFAGDRPRKVVLEVNAPDWVKLWIVCDQETHFLARVIGRDTVEFYVRGQFAILTQGNECFVYTVDGDGLTFETVSAESFAVIKERRERNYEFELMAARMQENMNRRLEQQAHELAARFERRMAAREAQSSDASAPGRAGAASGAGAVEQPEGSPAPAGKPGRGRPKRDADPGPAADD